MKISAFLAVMLLATPAFAHQGDHTGYDIAALIAHVFETDHIVFAAVAVITGVLAYRAGRRAEAKSSEVDTGSREDFAAEKMAEARAVTKKDRRHDSR